MAKLVDIWRSDQLVNLTRRQMPLIIDGNLTMIMDLNSLGAVCDSPLVRGKQLEEFSRKLDILTKEEIKASFEVTCKDMLAILGQAVPCVGCRRSVERLFYDLMKSAHPALDPLVITPNGLLTIKDEILESPQLLCTMLQGHSARLNSLVERQPRSKKSRRCALHSLEVQRMRPPSGAWRDVWECMRPACRQEVTLVGTETLEATLDTYLRKHRFCVECRTKVLLASSLLMTEPDPSKEKGYVSALYAGIKRCIPERHIHLPTNTDYISAIIERAQPELMGRERHAKTLEIAQEEVLTCLGICVSERLHRVHRRLREEETVYKVLAAVAVDALSRNFQMAVEVKQGISQLELLYEELTREEMAKQQRREKLRLKRKKKKERRYESEEKENTCQNVDESNTDENREPYPLCSELKESSQTTINRHEQSQPSDPKKSGQKTCKCPDCTKKLTETTNIQSQTNVSFPRKKKGSETTVTEKKSRGSKDKGASVHHNLNSEKEKKTDENPEPYPLCSETKESSQTTINRHEQSQPSDSKKSGQETCKCPDCTKKSRESTKIPSQTNASFPRKKKGSETTVTEKKSRGSKEKVGGAHQNLNSEIIDKGMTSISDLDMSFEPCHECKDLFEKRDGKWMIRDEFVEPSNKEIMDAWLGRPSKRFSMWMETKKRFDDEAMINKTVCAASSRRASSEQLSQDCGYSSGNNISSPSLPSTPEGSELACSESCCNNEEGDCHESAFAHKLVHSNPNLFFLRAHTNGKGSHGPTLTQMLEEGYSSEEDGNEESYIPAEEVKEFQSRMCQVIEKRKELRQTLRKRFAILCSHYKPHIIPRKLN